MTAPFKAGEPRAGMRGLPRLIQATRVSLAGLRAAYRHEQAFRQETLLALLLLPLGLWLGKDGTQKALLAGSIALVLIVELLNSAVEAVVDRIGTEHHEMSRQAKDLGSAAVLLALVNAGAIWLLVLAW